MIRLLTQREAAALLRLSERTLERLRITGLGPVFVKAGRRVLYRESDLEAWVESRVRGSTSESKKTNTL
jgi:excisionase family DNA binding protein